MAVVVEHPVTNVTGRSHVTENDDYLVIDSVADARSYDTQRSGYKWIVKSIKVNI
jgi:hypothetical protein